MIDDDVSCWGIEVIGIEALNSEHFAQDLDCPELIHIKNIASVMDL